MSEHGELQIAERRYYAANRACRHYESTTPPSQDVEWRRLLDVQRTEKTAYNSIRVRYGLEPVWP